MELQYNKILSESFLKIVGHFKSFKRLHTENITFYFSIYKNGTPGSGKSVHRNVVKGDIIRICDKNEDQYKFPELVAYKEYELAINSLIDVDGRQFHLPLIDFTYKKFDKFFIDALLGLKEKYPGDIYIFDSGRSFHGYHDILLSEEHWKEYLGELLLLNKKDFFEDIVDTRWIGHSLKQGFSCLRLSHNTRAYIKSPKFKTRI